MQSSVPELIAAAERGDRSVTDALFVALYSELRRVAQRELARQFGCSTVSATTLLHETYIDMVRRSGNSFPDRARFIAYASRVMRGLIIDHIRSHHAVKRGSEFHITSINTGLDQVVDDRVLTRLSDALDELASIEPGLAEVVDLRFFCGFTFAEIAELKDMSERSVQRQWEKARIFLHRASRQCSKDEGVWP